MVEHLKIMMTIKLLLRTEQIRIRKNYIPLFACLKTERLLTIHLPFRFKFKREYYKNFYYAITKDKTKIYLTT